LPFANNVVLRYRAGDAGPHVAVKFSFSRLITNTCPTARGRAGAVVVTGPVVVGLVAPGFVVGTVLGAGDDDDDDDEHAAPITAQQRITASLRIGAA
jgi:hypothetical protein